jgi:glycosyltransferase involved in cell wall biosynthesis
VRVAVDALGIDQLGGPRTVALNLLDALIEADRETELVVFLSRPERLGAAGRRVRQVVAGRLSPHLARLWAQAVMPLYARRWGASLLHHLKGLTVVGAPCPTVVTVHDLTILRHPDLYPAFEGWYWRRVQPRALGAATQLVAVSKTTADDLERLYGVPAGRVEVIYNSIAPAFSPGPADRAVLRRYGLECDFVLHVGSISRKKNLVTLARAFDRLVRRGMPLKLALVGRVYQKGSDEELGPLVDAAGLRERVVFTGPVTEEELVALYRAASAVAFPSLHEGFGLVPVEAMACGAPVVASTGGALGEVVGDAALLLRDGRDDAELAEALGRVIQDPACRAGLIERGRRRAGLFTPAEAARRTLAVYRRVARSDGVGG